MQQCASGRQVWLAAHGHCGISFPREHSRLRQPADVAHAPLRAALQVLLQHSSSSDVTVVGTWLCNRLLGGLQLRNNHAQKRSGRRCRGRVLRAALP